MNDEYIVSCPVAEDLSGANGTNVDYTALKLGVNGVSRITSINDRIIGILNEGNVAPAIGQTVGTNYFPACSLKLVNSNGIFFIQLGSTNTTAIARGDELQADAAVPGCFCKRTDGVPAAIAWDSAPATSTGGQIRAIMLPVNGDAAEPGVAVTQITSAATAVTANGLAGVITTVVQNIAAAANAEFTVNDNQVDATDSITVNVASGSVGGVTTAQIVAVGAGSFKVLLYNFHATVAETGTLVITFSVHKNS